MVKMNNTTIITRCRVLLKAYENKDLGNCTMPEDSNPGFKACEEEIRLVYFTLPMSLNYQRDSYKLWESALKTYNDPSTSLLRIPLFFLPVYFRLVYKILFLKVVQVKIPA